MALPLAGSLISISTKNEMRYEGTLVSIDAASSTILLSGVKALGTEGRPRKGGLPPIAASEHVFPSISFKGPEITEIKVLQAAVSAVAAGIQTQPSAAKVANPAVAPPPPSRETPRLPTLTEPMLAPLPSTTSKPLAPLLADPPASSRTASSVFDKQLDSKDVGVLTVSGLLPTDTVSDIRSLFLANAGAISAVKMQGRSCDVVFNDASFLDDLVRSFSHPRFSVNLLRPGRGDHGSRQGGASSASQQQQYNAPPTIQQQQQHHNVRRRQSDSRPPRDQHATHQPPPRVFSEERSSSTKPEKLTALFDFEKSNAKFEKERPEAASSSDKDPSAPAPQKSFFDNISTSASERNETRGKPVGVESGDRGSFRDQRIKNLETFGEMARSLPGRNVMRTGRPDADSVGGGDRRRSGGGPGRPPRVNDVRHRPRPNGGGSGSGGGANGNGGGSTRGGGGVPEWA